MAKNRRMVAILAMVFLVLVALFSTAMSAENISTIEPATEAAAELTTVTATLRNDVAKEKMVRILEADENFAIEKVEPEEATELAEVQEETTGLTEVEEETTGQPTEATHEPEVATEPVQEQIVETEPTTEWQGQVLTARLGTVQGPSGKETYYNLPMGGVVKIMRDLGYSEEEYPYWVREDGCKMLGDYILCAANLDIRPRGTILETSLGLAIVADTGGFAKENQNQIDIAVNW